MTCSARRLALWSAEGVLKMNYRKLGNTGLIVSEVALGTMQFGGKMNMDTAFSAEPRAGSSALSSCAACRA
jgi:hypothetical protein